MIRALPHQQQPPHPAYCHHCKAGFNNRRRMIDHLISMYGRKDARHPIPQSEGDRSE